MATDVLSRFASLCSSLCLLCITLGENGWVLGCRIHLCDESVVGAWGMQLLLPRENHRETLSPGGSPLLPPFFCSR